ncbi:MAG: hypothetical protein WC819_01945 [Parcubacteria group bacterium]|jgi:hypothetical protein
MSAKKKKKKKRIAENKDHEDRSVVQEEKKDNRFDHKRVTDGTHDAQGEQHKNIQKKGKHFFKELFRKIDRRTVMWLGTGLFLLLVICGVGYGIYYYQTQKEIIAYERKISSESYTQLMQQFEEDNIQEIATIQESLPTDAWKEFASKWYGFTIKYPESGWTVVTKKVDATSRAIYRVDFLKHSDMYSEPVGFSVAVYDTAKTVNLSDTDEFPAMKNNDLSVAGLCAVPSGSMIETGEYPAEEMYVPPMNECYESALFFTVVKGQYIYNIVPIVSTTAQGDGIDPMVVTADVVPEFFSAVSQFTNIDVVRPKPRPAVARISAPLPAAYKKDSAGRRVCNKKNDKPGKSNQHKSRHMDMECCLDPDEYPNPNCYYDPGKYGKYLK